jgi:hypothetical protein
MAVKEIILLYGSGKGIFLTENSGFLGEKRSVLYHFDTKRYCGQGVGVCNYSAKGALFF